MADFGFDLLILLDGSLRMLTPLVLAALGGLYAERAGVVDIALEGKMLGAAFAAAATAFVTGSPWAGLLAGVAVATLLSLLHGFVCITHKGEQIVSGMAINILVAGLAPTLANSWFSLNGQTPLLPSDSRFGAINWVGVDLIGDIPFIGPLYAEVISGHSVLTYLALLSVVAAAWL